MTTKETAAPDFSAFLLSPTGRVEINLPNGDPMLFHGARVAVNVYSPASAEFARAQAAMQRAARDRLMGGRKNNGNDAEAEASADANVRFLVGVTHSIENFPYPGGTEAMYRERGLLYIGEQVNTFLGDQGNFFGKSKTS